MWLATALAYSTVQTAPALVEYHLGHLNIHTVWVVALTTLGTGNQPTLVSTPIATTTHAHILVEHIFILTTGYHDSWMVVITRVLAWVITTILQHTNSRSIFVMAKSNINKTHTNHWLPKSTWNMHVVVPIINWMVILIAEIPPCFDVWTVCNYACSISIDLVLFIKQTRHGEYWSILIDQQWVFVYIWCYLTYISGMALVLWLWTSLFLVCWSSNTLTLLTNRYGAALSTNKSRPSQQWSTNIIQAITF